MSRFSLVNMRAFGIAGRVLVAVSLCAAPLAGGQSVDGLLERAVRADAEVLVEVQAYLHPRVPPLEVPDTLEAWEAEATALRQQFLDEIVMKGVPASWTEGPVKVEYLEDLENGQGYRIRKLRYEAVPGMWIPALLYEPDGDATNLPGVLNVNGHYGEGKVRPEEQIRCINFAKRGVIDIHPEWIGMGQLSGPDFDHGRSVYLDAAGVRGMSLFYLSLKRALDILDTHPRVDPARLAMSGLSGGGWQTAVYSALDERVSVIVPVAGHGAVGVRIDHGADIGDYEQLPLDMLTVADYTHLTALFAPRPALLIYNEKDECCFAAPRTLPAIFDPVVPVYSLYGAENSFRYHVNHDPGTHNYEADNRIQFYNFVDEYLVPDAEWDGGELPVAEEEILPVEHTNAELPADNKSIVSLALELARAIERGPIPAAGSAEFAPWAREKRAALAELLRYAPIRVHTVACDLASDQGGLSAAYRFHGADWTIPAMAIQPAGAGFRDAHLVLDDGGLPGAKERIAAIAGEGKLAVGVAPLFQDGNSPRSGSSWQYAMLLNATGERALAAQAAQVAAVVDWFKMARGAATVTVHARGVESGLIALVAAALHPGLIDAVETADIPESLIDVMESRGKYSSTPSVYNFGFLQRVDFAELRAMAG
ncbi:MAG: acetylxylan esterase [Candidatus Hydrogenedentes bacterium]|nr:acetylxylan esterase [Candidatus Hydrogenedentota bacterium]